MQWYWRTVHGTINTRVAGNTMAFAAAATATGASTASYVNGNVSRVGTVDFSFPVGDAGATVGGAYHPLAVTSIILAGLSATVIYTASRATPNVASLALLLISSVDPSAFWTFTNTGLAVGTVTIDSRDETNTFAPGAQVAIAGFTLGAWNYVGDVYTSTVTDQTLASSPAKVLSTFSSFTVGSNGSVILPITLTSFTGIASGCMANLTWQTSAENNSSYYAIEASTDAATFVQVASVTSKNSATGTTYNYTYKLGSGINYFRLRAVDNDGKYTYSNIISTTGTGACGVGLKVMVFPNPSSYSFNIQNLDGGRNRIGLYNTNGKKIIEIMTTATHQNIDIANYARGLYLLRIENANRKVTTLKVVKQ